MKRSIIGSKLDQKPMSALTNVTALSTNTADRDFGVYEEKVYLVFFMKIRETAQKDNHET
jgi:hypothetical protein